jgi:hypothetical protein
MGVGRTIISTVDVMAAHGFIPVVVNVRVAVPVNVEGGFHVAFRVFALGENVPPTGEVHVPPVADPPTDPPRITDPP